MRHNDNGGILSSRVIPICRVNGIPIVLDFSWVLIFGLVTYSMYQLLESQAQFIGQVPLFLASASIAILFFGSLLFHELAHSFVAQSFRIPVLSITLFLFGGVAKMGAEVKRPRDEFLIAIAGPMASFFLSAAFWVLAIYMPGIPYILSLVAYVLSLVNLALGIFNLLPGFPMDGGRVLRAAVWKWTGSYARASNAAALVGMFAAYGIIAWGVFQLAQSIIAGTGFQGIWMILIGGFILSTNRMSAAQAKIAARRERLARLVPQWEQYVNNTIDPPVPWQPGDFHDADSITLSYSTEQAKHPEQSKQE